MNFIIFKGSVETLEFFSKQIGDELTKLGHNVFTFNLANEFFSMDNLIPYCHMSCSPPILITFNHMGISGETIFLDKNGDSFFDEFKISVVNIIVDHPLYYHKVMKYIPKKYVQICIDEEHTLYMHRFYPNIPVSKTMYLAGCVCPKATMTTTHSGNLLPIKIKDRSMDFCFCGNYTPPSRFIKHLDNLNLEYKEFYMSILDTLKNEPLRELTDVLSSAIYSSLGDVCDKDLDAAMSNMIYADLYTRFYFRGKVIQTLVDSGFHIDVFGNGWDLLDCRNKNNLIQHGSVKTIDCLMAAANSKFSLNVMPWFKNGCHDRVYSSIMNGSICISDKSLYLSNHFCDYENIILYDLSNIDRLSKRLSLLLNDYDKMQSIADRGYFMSVEKESWHSRINFILDVINQRFL